MNPESLLHEAAGRLQAEAEKGPGTMFVVKVGSNFTVTRTPSPADEKQIVARFDCAKFSAGLNVNTWAALLKSIWAAHLTDQKGAASGAKPAKPA